MHNAKYQIHSTHTKYTETAFGPNSPILGGPPSISCQHPETKGQNLQWSKPILQGPLLLISNHCPVNTLRWSKEQNRQRKQRLSNYLLAPSGALIAIPAYYWSSPPPPPHFFRSHRSSTLDFHFLSHYSYTKAIMLYKGNHWTRCAGFMDASWVRLGITDDDLGTSWALPGDNLGMTWGWLGHYFGKTWQDLRTPLDNFGRVLQSIRE